MADSNIGALPQAEQLEDDSLLVAEQQGKAVKVTGAQFKEFGRQAVVGQVQGYVDQAQAAAAEAGNAVESVTGMTVSAHSGETASVSKSIREGKVHLAFGLPRGEQGVPGPEGPAGPRGARGETGKGLTILGYFDSLGVLEAAVTAPEPGDAYGVGTEAPFDIFVFDGVSGTWKNNGPLSGGGSIVPENVVTSEGGAALEIPEGFGSAPHLITFDEEEDVSLTAEDIAYRDTSVAEALGDLFTCVSDGKALVASAITDKGVETAQDASFAQMAEHIGQISDESDTSDADAGPGDILAGKTAYSAHGKVEGVIPNLGARTYTPGTQAQTIANGQYLSGVQTIQGDPNLTSGNIKKGVSIFGVAGAVEQSFLATLTVTADVGAVVTATHSGGAQVEALSTTGTVTLELPLEGQWTVTARRGVAQYNSVTIEVSSRYAAALTAEVHIEYYSAGTPLSSGRDRLAAAAVGDYVLFAGGHSNGGSFHAMDAYSMNLVHSTPSSLNAGRYSLVAAAVGNFALFAGGYNGTPKSDVEAYSASLTRSTKTPLSEGRYGAAAATVGNFALFGGGNLEDYTYSSIVDAYDVNLTHSIPTPFTQPVGRHAAAATENYVLFAGGETTTVYAYNASLTRSTPTQLSERRIDLAAARAGNYVVFAGGSRYSASAAAEAYDMFLTRTTAEALQVARGRMGATAVGGHALFGGGYTTTGTPNAASSRYFSAAMDAYDPYLTHTTPTSLKTNRPGAAAATVGNYALLGGGYSYSSAVDIYRYV